jgi:hypothetical protein
LPARGDVSRLNPLSTRHYRVCIECVKRSRLASHIRSEARGVTRIPRVEQINEPHPDESTQLARGDDGMTLVPGLNAYRCDVATVMCPACLKFVLYEQMLLADTAASFPKLGRRRTAVTPSTLYLQVMTCPGDGKSFARWFDRPDDPLRRFDPKNVVWLD